MEQERSGQSDQPGPVHPQHDHLKGITPSMVSPFGEVTWPSGNERPFLGGATGIGIPKGTDPSTVNPFGEIMFG